MSTSKKVVIHGVCQSQWEIKDFSYRKTFFLLKYTLKLFYRNGVCSNYSSGFVPVIKSVALKGSGLEVSFDDGKNIYFESCWLRDQCRCAVCFSAKSGQRLYHILELPDVSFVKVDHTDTDVRIKWTDNHISTYGADFLEKYDYPTWNNRLRTIPKLWKGENVAPLVARVPVQKFLNTDEGAKLVFRSLLDYGLAFIEEVEPTLEATEQVCKNMGGIQNTLFGGMYTIKPEPGASDTAYMSEGMKQHTDLSSFTEPAGLEIFHCIQHDGTGGESVVSDGFYAAYKLKEEQPEDFEFLTTHEVEAEYKFNGHSFRYQAPAIELDKHGDIKTIRFNAYDRAPMAFATPKESKQHYRALKNFANHIENPKYHWTFKLKPGTVLIFDNFRALHGRTGFTGMRVIVGSFVSRNDWLDRARSLGLVV